ncbi:MAG: hypothetical protein C5B50_15555 [Verrucomicrobia bacterium]|nr:MAG: hypothetical protein C5B50_15555 [Verrucomicrobiota bacterium]
MDPPTCADRRQFAQELADFRAKMSLTQDDLAAKLGVSRRTLQNWERVITRPIGRFWREIRSALCARA